MQKYLFPRSGRDLVVTFTDDRLELDDGESMLLIEVTVHGVFASCGPVGEEITEDPVGALASIYGPEGVELILRSWLRDVLGVPSSQALETILRRQLPLVDEFTKRYPNSPVPARLSPRLFSALRAPNLRDATRNYLDDLSATVSDAKAFACALDGGRKFGLCENHRVWAMALAPAGFREDLADSPVVMTGVVPPASIRSITENLTPHVARDFALAAARDRRSGLQLTAAHRLGLKAEGSDGEGAYVRILEQLLTSEFAAPSGIIDQIVQRGLGGHAVRRVATPTAAKELGEAQHNCLASEAYPWLDRIRRREVDILEIGGVDTVAIVALSKSTPIEILEARGPHNCPPPRRVLEDLRSQLAAAS